MVPGQDLGQEFTPFHQRRASLWAGPCPSPPHPPKLNQLPWSHCFYVQDHRPLPGRYWDGTLLGGETGASCLGYLGAGLIEMIYHPSHPLATSAYDSPCVPESFSESLDRHSLTNHGDLGQKHLPQSPPDLSREDLALSWKSVHHVA